MRIRGKAMDKKILIGSIIAVVILTGVSFTSVVGYNSVESYVKASPLFNIRASRAIDEDSKDLTCNYVGKGKASILSIPKRDSRATLIQNVVNKVKKMDDKTFDRYLDFLINRLQQSQNINDETTKEIITLFKQMRNEPTKPVNYRLIQKIESDTRLATEICKTSIPTNFFCGCGIWFWLTVLLIIALVIFDYIIIIPITILFGCIDKI